MIPHENRDLELQPGQTSDPICWMKQGKALHSNTECISMEREGCFFFTLSTLCSNNEAISDCGQHDDVWRPNAMRGNVAATEPGVERWTNQNTDHENIN